MAAHKTGARKARARPTVAERNRLLATIDEQQREADRSADAVAFWKREVDAMARLSNRIKEERDVLAAEVRRVRALNESMRLADVLRKASNGE